MGSESPIHSIETRGSRRDIKRALEANNERPVPT
jgi:hypothetical protein